VLLLDVSVFGFASLHLQAEPSKVGTIGAYVKQGLLSV